MLIVYLAHSGGRVEIPQAVECVDTGDTDYVSFLDDKGVCLAQFRRADISMYAPPEQVARVEAASEKAPAQDGNGRYQAGEAVEPGNSE